MVTLVARQSIIIKCNMQTSALLGNYEFYYAAGLFCRLRHIEVDADILPGELKEKILPALKESKLDDPKERYLVNMLLGYEPAEEYETHMKELLRWGLLEERIWQVN